MKADLNILFGQILGRFLFLTSFYVLSIISPGLASVIRAIIVATLCEIEGRPGQNGGADPEDAFAYIKFL